MRDLIVVLIAAITIAACTLLHKFGGSLAVGIAVGAVYFLKAVTSGNGIAEVQLGTLTNPNKKPIDPASSIGMGLAASGIAAAAMGSSDYTVALGAFLPAALVLGLTIAVGYAVVGLKQGRTKIAEAKDLKTSSEQTNAWKN